MPQLNKNLENVSVPGTRQMANRVADMPDSIDLTLGQPDFTTPQVIKDEVTTAVKDRQMKYTHNRGTLELRTAISNFYQKKYLAPYDPKDEIIVTNGGSEALDTIFRTIINPGDEVIMFAPIYTGYAPIVTLLGGETVLLDTAPAQFVPEADQLAQAITDKTKAVLLNYPNNPTGTIYPRGTLDALVHVFKKHDIFVVVDEMYSENTLEGEHFSLTSYPEIRDRLLTVNGLSKSHAMTGWRIGWLLGSREMVEKLTLVHLYNSLCTSTPSQIAGYTALTEAPDAPRVMNEEYVKRRDYIYQRLSEMGLDAVLPKGAFYIFPSIKRYNESSFDFAVDLLEKTQVAVVPGAAFSKYGEGYIRISFATSMENLKEAADRMEQYLTMER
ncbi:aminotransferase class I/II-fold pyridoxal phosphate-dependent enzyme [Salinicoccus albus]|uniref:aminotransferase class I/II-fold pyridoxal phosphate-dependent enzyme n=1 Tax=Salinicoccus albus TaxID=418756 RepID=UPI000363A0EF|nr:aminotransferase class I/II-fold pyridoxal phosphate-dependent enzyme [Salinicoccus albus]